MRDRIEFSTVRGYLFAIVRNLFLQNQRRETRRRPLDEEMVDDRPGPEIRAGDHDELRIVLAALPLTVTFNRAGFQGLMIDNWPERIVLLAIAAALWGAYVLMPRRWRAGS